MSLKKGREWYRLCAIWDLRATVYSKYVSNSCYCVAYLGFKFSSKLLDYFKPFFLIFNCMDILTWLHTCVIMNTLNCYPREV